MPYQKFKVQDNAYWNLLSGISASATTINLETGDGSRFPADNFVATLVEYTTTGDDTTPILWQEKILATARSGDTLTVTRGYDGSTPRSFNAGDNIYLNVTSVIIEDIQDEVTRLETDKLDVSDFNSTLRNNLGNWKVIYTNGTGDETELTLWSAGQFLKSNGATSAPTFESPTVDINWLTEDNDALDSDDMLVYYDGAGNKKRKAKATTSQEWLVRQLTDTEAKAWSNAWYISWEQMIDEVTNRPWIIIAGTTYIASSAPTVNQTKLTTSFAKVIYGNVLRAWTYRVTFDLSGTSWNDVSARIYVDWVQVWPDYNMINGADISVSVDLTIWAWEELAVYAKKWWSWTNNEVENYLVRYDMNRLYPYTTSTI